MSQLACTSVENLTKSKFSQQTVAVFMALGSFRPTYCGGRNAVVTCEIIKKNNFEIISVFSFTCNHCWWLRVK